MLEPIIIAVACGVAAAAIYDGIKATIRHFWR